MPQYQAVVLEYGTTQTLLVPSPQVLQAKPGDAERFLGMNVVDANVEYFWVKGVPRSYSLDLIQRSNYLLNAYQTSSGVWAGTRATVEIVDKNQLLEWHVFVKKARVR